jgi:hypothetical protein
MMMFDAMHRKNVASMQRDDTMRRFILIFGSENQNVVDSL